MRHSSVPARGLQWMMTYSAFVETTECGCIIVHRRRVYSHRRKTAGIGVNVDIVSLESGPTTITFGATDVITAAGTNRVNASGTLAIPLAIFYTRIAGDREINTTVPVACTDERRNVITVGVSWDVQ